MAHTIFTPDESADIREWFGVPAEQLTEPEFRRILRELRSRYHPDNFEKFGDETVRLLATERFQRIERLAEKLEVMLNGSSPGSSAPAYGSSGNAAYPEPIFDPRARFAYQAMKIEIRTNDKDLKYHLFGTFYRWLTMGERFKIPETQAFLVADEDYQGRSIGFMETIRVYLTFEENDSIEAVVHWLHPRISGRADALLIEGEIIPIDFDAITTAIKRRSFKSLNSGE